MSHIAAAPRPLPYRISRRIAAAHRRHANAAYPGCVLCILAGEAATGRATAA
jgi:hypothetical protein